MYPFTARAMFPEFQVSLHPSFFSFFSGALCPQKSSAADEKGKKATAIILNLYQKIDKVNVQTNSNPCQKDPPTPLHFHLHHASLELLGRRQGLLQCAEHLHGVKERCKYHLSPGYRGKERGFRTYEPKSQFRFEGSSFQDFQVVYSIFLSKLPKIKCLSVTFLAPRLLWRVWRFRRLFPAWVESVSSRFSFPALKNRGPFSPTTSWRTSHSVIIEMPLRPHLSPEV